MSERDSAGGQRYAWYVVAVLTLANVSGFVDRQILSLLVRPIQRDFGITDTQMSYLLGLSFAVFYSVLGIPIARWADRSSRRAIMGGGVALWSVFTTLCSTASTFGRLFIMRLGVGVGEASLQAPSVSLISDYFPRERLSRAMSVYSLGIFVGSGLAYLIGGWVVGFASTEGMVNLPVIGAVRPWQTVFVAVGLPGFVIAALIVSLREPLRRAGDEKRPQEPFSVFLRYVAKNKLAYLSHGLGFAVSGAVNFALGGWIPTLFVRSFGWNEGRAGIVQGTLTITIGVAGVLVGGRIADGFVARGKIDGPMRVGIIAAVGMLISATAFPLMPTAGLAVAWLAVVNFFAAFPWGAAAAAAAEMAPVRLRAQSAALFFLLLNLISQTLGPISVALFNDHVFGRGAGVRYSIAIVSGVGMVLTIVLLSVGLAAYRETVSSRDRA
ncbi:MAG TPA: MFS transporter [Gemmatimonadaceae bacterium]|jgi:MFS family permease